MKSFSDSFVRVTGSGDLSPFPPAIAPSRARPCLTEKTPFGLCLHPPRFTPRWILAEVQDVSPAFQSYPSRIQTFVKGLLRFRLCPASAVSSRFLINTRPEQQGVKALPLRRRDDSSLGSPPEKRLKTEVSYCLHTYIHFTKLK